MGKPISPPVSVDIKERQRREQLKANLRTGKKVARMPNTRYAPIKVKPDGATLQTYTRKMIVTSSGIPSNTTPISGQSNGTETFDMTLEYDALSKEAAKIRKKLKRIISPQAKRILKPLEEFFEIDYATAHYNGQSVWCVEGVMKKNPNYYIIIRKTGVRVGSQYEIEIHKNENYISTGTLFANEMTLVKAVKNTIDLINFVSSCNW